MKFALQTNDKDGKFYDSDIQLVYEVLNRNHLHQYELVGFSEITSEKYKDFIPVGTLEFVTAHLKQFHDINKIEPIEVPEFLRTPEFLKRTYRIMPFNETPNSGRFFFKDVSELKRFSYTGSAKEFQSFNEVDRSHLFQVSEDISDIIFSEYRVYVFQGRVESISNYDGDVLVFPDTSLIKKAITICNYQKSFPKSYSLDLAVTERGTALIEIHPFVSVGLYSTLWGNNLLQAYKDGYEYIVEHNTPLKA